jgi:hypothetical protein
MNALALRLTTIRKKKRDIPDDPAARCAARLTLAHR